MRDAAGAAAGERQADTRRRTRGPGRRSVLRRRGAMANEQQQRRDGGEYAAGDD
jgi:hypothetical protein